MRVDVTRQVARFWTAGPPTRLLPVAVPGDLLMQLTRSPPKTNYAPNVRLRPSFSSVTVINESLEHRARHDIRIVLEKSRN